MLRIDIKRFLQILGCRSIKDQGEWVSAECPLAPWTHPKRTDRHPSFAIRVNGAGQSLYKCFTCKQKAAPLDCLIELISKYHGRYARTAADFFVTYEIFEDPQEFKHTDKWACPEAETPKVKPVEIMPLAVLDVFQPLSQNTAPNDVLEVLKERGVNLSVCEYYGVKWSTEHNALIFPSLLNNGVTSIKARRLTDKSFFFIKGGLYLFGLSRIDWSKPVWLVEGEFDLLRLNSLGEYNCVCLGGSSVSVDLGRHLHCHSLIAGFDNDEPGRNATERLKKLYGAYYHIRVADWGEHKDAGALRNRQELDEVRKNIS